MIKKLFKKSWEWAKPYFKLKMLPFLALAWVITNGWAYAFVVIGPAQGIKWMTAIGGAWIAFLWFPLTIEKPITIAIAVFLYRLFYKEKFKDNQWMSKKGVER